MPDISPFCFRWSNSGVKQTDSNPRLTLAYCVALASWGAFLPLVSSGLWRGKNTEEGPTNSPR